MKKSGEDASDENSQNQFSFSIGNKLNNLAAGASLVLNHSSQQNNQIETPKTPSDVNRISTSNSTNEVENNPTKEKPLESQSENKNEKELVQKMMNPLISVAQDVSAMAETQEKSTFPKEISTSPKETSTSPKEIEQSYNASQIQEDVSQLNKISYVQANILEPITKDSKGPEEKIDSETVGKNSEQSDKNGSCTNVLEDLITENQQQIVCIMDEENLKNIESNLDKENNELSSSNVKNELANSMSKPQSNVDENLNIDIITLDPDSSQHEEVLLTQPTKVKSDLEELSNDSPNHLEEKPKKKKKHHKTQEITFDPQKLLQLFIIKGQIPPKDKIPEVISSGEDLTQRLIDSEDYDRAKTINEAVKALRDFSQTLPEGQSTKPDEEIVKARLTSVSENESQIRSFYAKQITEAQENSREKRKVLQKQHQEQIQAFEKHWNDPKTLAQFNRPSTSLIEMRRIQKQLAAKHDFDQAKAMKIHADSLEQEEIKIQKEKAMKCMKHEYRNLMEKHQKESAIFEAKEKQIIDNLIKERDVKLDANAKLKKHLMSKTQKSPPNLIFMNKGPAIVVPNTANNALKKESLKISSQLDCYRLNFKIENIKETIKTERAPNGKIVL